MAKKKTIRNIVSKNEKSKWDRMKCGTKDKCSCGGGCGYFIGFIGAAVYYISHTTGFWNGVWGFIKAMVWPAFLVYEVLKFLGA